MTLKQTVAKLKGKHGLLPRSPFPRCLFVWLVVTQASLRLQMFFKHSDFWNQENVELLNTFNDIFSISFFLTLGTGCSSARLMSKSPWVQILQGTRLLFVVLACHLPELDGFKWQFQGSVHFTISSAVNKSHQHWKIPRKNWNRIRGCWVRSNNATSVLCFLPLFWAKFLLLFRLFFRYKLWQQ